ncbi:class I SAM-dependent methyltransferase [Candidatus Nomurabacteria bacterium]|nr:class I SAM-dependent methyltransferase [Candidatus Nomurabacteria bacterium]
MKSLKEQFIGHVVGEAIKRAPAGRPPRIMDLGCGTASYVPPLVEQCPNFEYVGVEPIEDSYTRAKENLAGVPNAKVHFQLAYDSVPEEKENSFDLVFSLSVLEHVKDLQSFISLSAKYVRRGGLMVHRYDLGHALHTHSLKEHFHVFMGNNFPQLLPERQFVRYVGVPEVEEKFRKAGVTPTDVTYHQMPSHKELEKHFNDSGTTAVDELFAWEIKHQKDFKKITEKDRELLFPAVAVWGEKWDGPHFARG